MNCLRCGYETFNLSVLVSNSLFLFLKLCFTRLLIHCSSWDRRKSITCNIQPSTNFVMLFVSLIFQQNTRKHFLFSKLIQSIKFFFSRVCLNLQSKTLTKVIFELNRRQWWLMFILIVVIWIFGKFSICNFPNQNSYFTFGSMHCFP